MNVQQTLIKDLKMRNGHFVRYKGKDFRIIHHEGHYALRSTDASDMVNYGFYQLEPESDIYLKDITQEEVGEVMYITSYVRYAGKDFPLVGGNEAYGYIVHVTTTEYDETFAGKNYQSELIEKYNITVEVIIPSSEVEEIWEKIEIETNYFK